MKSTYSYSLSPKQFATAAVINGRTAAPPFFRRAALLSFGAGFLAIGVLAGAGMEGSPVPASLVLAASVAAAALILLTNMIGLAGYRRALASSTFNLAPHEVDIEAEGLRVSTVNSRLFAPWSTLQGARLADDTIHVRIDSVTFIPVPLSAFESREEADEFISTVNARIRETSGGAAIHPVAAEPPAAPPSAAALPGSRTRTITAAIVDALRLSFFLKPREGRPTGSWSAVFFLAIVGAFLPTVMSFASLGLGGQWYSYNLPDALAHVPLLLLAAIAAAYSIGRPADVPRIFSAGLLIEIFVDLVQTLAMMAMTGDGSLGSLGVNFALLAIAPAWLMLAYGTYAARQVEAGLPRLGALLASILILWPLGTGYRDRSLWQQVFDDPERSAAARLDRAGAGAEDVFYKQPALLAQSLEAIRPGKKGVIDVFFVAFGGYGDQDVFRREVDATTALMSERFGAEGHSIRLINNGATLRDLPIASKTSLRAALNRIASVMDRDEDVLVLFMTSHGSQKHRFSLQLWPMRFDEIDPVALRSLLDESGIRNRVVIVSACYSGGFVKPLEDPNTLVVTAAATDKTSFGCSNEAEWTYFGKAYFDDGLRTTHSFTKAFEIATPLIVEREAKVRADKSDPQMSVGVDIAPRLAALEQQLEGRSPAIPPPKPAAATPDKYEQYVEALFLADYLEDYRKACAANMELSSPAAVLKKRPEAFQGMEKAPALWRDVTAAYDRYASSYCAKANDFSTIRKAYMQRVRSLLRESDIDSALAFLRTESGAEWLKRDREATRQQVVETGRMQSDLAERMYKEYLEVETRAFAALRKERPQ